MRGPEEVAIILTMPKLLQQAEESAQLEGNVVLTVRQRFKPLRGGEDAELSRAINGICLVLLFNLA